MGSIILRKNIVLSRLLELAPFCQPASASDGPLLLGWRLPEQNSDPVFEISGSAQLSAEAIAGIGVLDHVFRRSKDQGGKPLKTGATISRVERVINGAFPERNRWELLPNGMYALLLRRVWLADRQCVVTEVEKIMDDLISSPGDVARLLAPLRKLLRRLLTEALLNVHEHAYGHHVPGWAWVAAVVQPTELARAVNGADPAMDVKELGWLETFPGSHLLELAVADAGRGIPASLSRRAIEKRPLLARDLATLSAGRTDFHELRARLHASLCDYAFHHDSTRKEDSEFLNEFHLLNWRGLYRCYRQVVELGGGTIVNSGRGRAGYSAHGSGTVSFNHALPARGDFPGTLFTVRLPLPCKQIRRSRGPVRANDFNSPLQISSRVLAWDDVWAIARQPGSPPADAENDESRILPLALPLMEVVPTTEEVGTAGGDPAPTRVSGVHLREALARALRQDTVPLLCWGAFAGDWRREFRLTVPSAAWPPADDGPPRLVGLLQQDGAVQWVFAGAIPLETERPLRELEETGEWRDDGAHDMGYMWTRLREEMCAHYPDHVVWDRRVKTLRLRPFGASLTLADYQRVFAAAWTQYWQRENVRQEVIFERTNACVLLATGTRIRRHFSVFRLLHQSRALTAALGQLFAQHVLVNAGQHPLVVIDQPASRYICHALFAEVEFETSVYSLDELPLGPARKVVVFADAILRGRTVQSTVATLRRRGFTVALVVACVDLRNEERGKPLPDGVPVVSLVNADGFHAEEILDPTGLEEWRTDSLTHIPLKDRSSIFAELAENREAREFLYQHPERFNVGFHVRSGRTHTVTLPVSGLMEEPVFRQLARDWFLGQIREAAEANCGGLRGHDVVIFSRFDARLARMAPLLADSLRAELGAEQAVYGVALPAGYSESHTVYPQLETELFASSTELATGQLAFPSRRKPKAGYIGIYLDDAAVTGNSLRDFLHRAIAGVAPRPGVILALAALNRLSPGEVRFLGLCGALGAPGAISRPVPFRYTYFFNVQVRFLRSAGPVRHPLLETALASRRVHHEELRHYLAELRERTLHISQRQPLRHVFCTAGEAAPVSVHAVRLRHLLALNQQNEPVVMEILHAVKEASGPSYRDPSILTMLALEPALLQNPPLRQFGRHMLIDLAINVLSSKTPLTQRSDALVVLASYPRAFHDHYRKIADGALGDDALSRQLAVHLLAHGDPTEPIWVPPHLSDLSSDVSQRQLRLHRIITAVQRIEHTREELRSESDARHVIARLGSHFLHHAGPALADWDQLARRLQTLVRYWSKLGNPDRRGRDLGDCAKGIAFAEKILLPAFPAFARFAHRQDLSDLADTLEEAHALAEDRLADFRAALPSTPERASESQVRLVSAAFDALHEATWFAPTADRLLARDPLPQDAGPLAKAFPALFSAPTTLLVRIAEHVFEGKTELERLREPRSGNHRLTICPVPVEPLQQIFQLLLGNIVQCGDPATIRARAELLGSDERTGFTLRVELRNAITAPHNPNGQHQGIIKARQMGEPYGIDIHSDEDKLATGREWLTIVTIPGAFQLDQMIQHLHP